MVLGVTRVHTVQVALLDTSHLMQRLHKTLWAPGVSAQPICRNICRKRSLCRAAQELRRWVLLRSTAFWGVAEMDQQSGSSVALSPTSDESSAYVNLLVLCIPPYTSCYLLFLECIVHIDIYIYNPLLSILCVLIMDIRK